MGRRGQKRGSDGPSDVPEAKRRRKHLYLAVDYLGLGPSFHMVDLPSNSDSDGAKEQLPDPFISLDTPDEYSQYIMAALGKNIIAMPLTESNDNLMFHTGSYKKPTVLDVHSLGLSVGPEPVLQAVNPTFIPTANRLFVLSSNSFQVLNLPSVEEAGGTCWNGLWCELPMHPFKGVYITATAVHKDGRIFVSAESNSLEVTYSFHMSSGWTKIGDWVLPFTGHAHFFKPFNAWVGIYDKMGIRFICSCDLPCESDDGSGAPCPSLLDEFLFSTSGDEWRNGAILLFDGRRFCLVEVVSPIQSYCSVFRLTRFSLMYNKDGDLTTCDSVLRRCYEVPDTALGYSLVKPLAFWL